MEEMEEIEEIEFGNRRTIRKFSWFPIIVDNNLSWFNWYYDFQIYRVSNRNREYSGWESEKKSFDLEFEDLHINKPKERLIDGFSILPDTLFSVIIYKDGRFQYDRVFHDEPTYFFTYDEVIQKIKIDNPDKLNLYEQKLQEAINMKWLTKNKIEELKNSENLDIINALVRYTTKVHKYIVENRSYLLRNLDMGNNLTKCNDIAEAIYPIGDKAKKRNKYLKYKKV